MDINQLTANIDQQLLKLEQQINALDLEVGTANHAESKTLEALNTLQKAHEKLSKSRAIMWQAYDLQQTTTSPKKHRHQRLGLALCIISILGLGITFAVFTKL